jgi:hypothetical protein
MANTMIPFSDARAGLYIPAWAAEILGRRATCALASGIESGRAVVGLFFINGEGKDRMVLSSRGDEDLQGMAWAAINGGATETDVRAIIPLEPA